jgi:hypothetical protein
MLVSRVIVTCCGRIFQFAVVGHRILLTPPQFAGAWRYRCFEKMPLAPRPPQIRIYLIALFSSSQQPQCEALASLGSPKSDFRPNDR